MQMRLTVLFPECNNVCLLKDVGMIPYILCKNHGYSAKIACYQNDMQYKNMDLMGDVKLQFMKRITGNSLLDGCFYLLKAAKNIDVLQLYHATTVRNFAWIILYKLINHKGFIYIKMDAEWKVIQEFNYRRKGIRGYFKRRILSECKLLSAETKELCEKISMDWGRKIEYIPNGFFQTDRKRVKYDEKENIICTVGRIGTYQKATEVLLEAFKKCAKYNNWNLRIIGGIEAGFEHRIDAFFRQNSELKNRVIFTGNIEDRKRLEQEYSRAKIFCLPSRFESFGIVYLEALRYGCYVISTDVEPVNEILDHQQYGRIVPIDDVDLMAEFLLEAMRNEKVLEEKSEKAQKYVEENYNWDKIGKKLDSLLMEYRL